MTIQCTIVKKQPIQVSIKKSAGIKLLLNGVSFHFNKKVLDLITQVLIDNWNEAYDSSHSHSNKSVIDAIDLEKFWYWNSKSDGDHNHDIDYYKKNLIDELLSWKSNTNHNHSTYESQIQNILSILSSDDTTLDQIQEIVNYIKQNKEILDTLSIGNISGLQTALNSKSDSSHNHDTDYYKKSSVDSLLANKSDSTHTHSTYESQIQNIFSILSSDDTTLDQLQEIVNYIKQNKEILDTLGISNIAWLENALWDKVDKVSWMWLSKNSYTDEEKTKLANTATRLQTFWMFYSLQ